MINFYQIPLLTAQTGIFHAISTRNINSLAEATAELKINRYVISEQIHENKIFIVQDILKTTLLSGYDAFITKQKETALIIKTADCTPILLYDPKQQAIGAIHAGRKSTILKITELTVKKMIGHFQCSPQDILAGIGPAICKKCHQIDPVKDIHFDLWQENLDQLLAAGLLRKNIDLSGLCPSCNAHNRFYSYRQDKTQKRTYNIIMLRN